TLMPDEHITPQRVPNSSLPTDERIVARPVSSNSSTGGGLWYLLLRGKEVGPFTSEELTAKLGDGSLHPEDLVRMEHGTWAPAGNFLAFTGRLADGGSVKSHLHGGRKRAAGSVWGGWLGLAAVFLLLGPFQICCGILAVLGRDRVLGLGSLL